MKTHRIFYGWWIVLVCGIGLSSSPGQFAFGALGLFIAPLGVEFGWNRAQISLALTIFTAALATTLPLIGRAVDRRGSKEVLLPSLAAFGLLLATIPLFVSNLWHLYLVFALLGSIGAGANVLPYLRILGAWFSRNRGLAFGLALAGSGLGYAYVPPLMQFLIDRFGWRSGYYVLSGIVLLVALPLLHRVLKNKPQELGLLPDGDAQASAGQIESPPAFRAAELLRNRVFCVMFVVFLTLSISLYGLMAHLMPMLTDRGMPATHAALVASLLGVAITVARPLIGYLIDRFFAPRVGMIGILLAALGTFILSDGAVGASAAIAAILIGFTIGAEIDLLAYMTARYFGLNSFGLAYGMLFTAFLLGTAAGPLVYGLGFDASGSYNTVLAVCGTLLVLSALGLLLLPRYEHEPRYGTATNN